MMVLMKSIAFDSIEAAVDFQGANASGIVDCCIW